MSFKSFKYSQELFERCKELNVLGNWFYQNKNNLRGDIFLNIGITPKNGVQWLDFFIEDLNYKEAFSIEINSKYILKLKKQNHIYKLIHGDVRNIDNLISKQAVDIIGWFQGPEHIHMNELKETFKKIFYVSKLGIVCTCPYGTGYDKAEGHKILNPVPKIFLDLDLDLKVFTWGKKDTLEAGMCIYKLKGLE